MKKLLLIPMIMLMTSCANLGPAAETAVDTTANNINECLQKQREAFLNGSLYGANAFIKLSQAKTLPADPKEAAIAVKKEAWSQLVEAQKAADDAKAEKEGKK